MRKGKGRTELVLSSTYTVHQGVWSRSVNQAPPSRLLTGRLQLWILEHSPCHNSAALIAWL